MIIGRKQEQEKRTVEDEVRAHLRGFARTIPSFARTALADMP